jgi:hypothetical protein
VASSCSLKRELAEARINVNCIAPGYIQRGAGFGVSAGSVEEHSWGRFGTPADVAAIAPFLASCAADYVTGEVFAVNGGAFWGRIPRWRDDDGHERCRGLNCPAKGQPPAPPSPDSGLRDGSRQSLCPRLRGEPGPLSDRFGR